MRLRIAVLVVTICGVPAQVQNAGGEIRGFVVDAGDRPVQHARIELRQETGQVLFNPFTTARDGSFRITNLVGGAYILDISASGFHPSHIHDINVRDTDISALSPIRLKPAAFYDCSTERPPDYYRPLGSMPEAAAVAGIVTDDSGSAIAGAVVVLYRHGTGAIASETSDGGGKFSFSAVQRRPAEYWLSISHEGYFREELPRLTIEVGFESVYAPVILERCRSGHCEPHLKTIRVLRVARENGFLSTDAAHPRYYSARNVRIGSIRDAFHAGTRLAITLTMNRNATTNT